MASTSTFRWSLAIAVLVFAVLSVVMLSTAGCVHPSDPKIRRYVPTVAAFGPEPWNGLESLESPVSASVEPSVAACRLTAMERSLQESSVRQPSVFDGADPGSTVVLVVPCSVPTSATFDAKDGTGIWDSLKPTSAYWVVLQRENGRRSFFIRRGETWWEVCDSSSQLLLHALEKYMAREGAPSEARLLRTDESVWFVLRQPSGLVEASPLVQPGYVRVYIDGVKIEEGVAYDPRLVFKPFELP